MSQEQKLSKIAKTNDENKDKTEKKRRRNRFR